MTTHRTTVGISGGVDSSVSALLLKQQGHNVNGLHMQNWEADRDDPYCHADQDLSDARAVCDQIGVPLETVSFADEYWHNVFQYCLDEFAAGRTPNPDIWCNQQIKFNVFLKEALARGSDYLATGHYVRKRERDGRFELLRGLDVNKDQSYFLYTLGQYELKHSLFPVGELAKPEVRRLASDAGLVNQNKRDSTGICFIGERKFKSFLREYLLAKPGEMQTTDGCVVGKHDGLMFYTLGQRRGLDIGGRKAAAEAPWYVLAKDIPNNILIVGQGHDHPWLYSQRLECQQCFWVSGEAPPALLTCTAKIRYRHTDVPCVVTPTEDDCCKVHFKEPQWAITPGQSVVFYQDEVCLGGATIVSKDEPNDKASK